MFRLLAALLLLAAALPLRAGDGGFEAALTQAKAKAAPLLLEFHAPWCYSCYFMQKNVLTGPEWARVQREAVVLAVDADAPEGAALKERFGVKALPSYVVLNPAGDELGRISAERTRAQFYPELAAITRRNTTLDALRATAAQGGKSSVAAARAVLSAHLARRESAAGLTWFAALPAAARVPAANDAAVQRTLARLALQGAAQRKAPEACLAAAENALTGALDCESAYDLDTALDCSATAASDHRRGFLQAQLPRFEAQLQREVLTPRPRCADARSAVFALADGYQMQGNAAARAATFTAAIQHFERRVKPGLKADRNAADNLRVFYEAAGETAKLDALLQQLVAAYPDDYVYANRAARVLAARQDHAQALPLFAQAAEHAYGINRLRNAQGHVQSLLALEREAEARRVAAEALKANGPWFADEAAKLKSLLSAPTP